MEVIKKKIFLENSIDRRDNSKTWGVMTATTFYLNVLLTQNIDDMGLFNDMSFVEKNNTIPNYSVLKDKLINEDIHFPFMYGYTPDNISNINETDKIILRLPSKTIDNYYNYGNLKITGATDSKIEDIRTYSTSNPFIIGFDVNKTTYVNYKNEVINGVDRLTSMSDPKTYVFDTNNDINLGTSSQTSGLLYQDYSGITREVKIDNITETIPLTVFNYIGEGMNETNSSLSAISKEEYLFGIISKPEVESDVFIDRSTFSVMDLHLKLSEIKNLGQLTRYGNGFYKINKQ